MPRSSRIVLPGVAHHVTQRGNNRQAVFHDNEDFEKFLELLQHYGDQHKLRTVAYCLMTNHTHLVVVPGFEHSLAEGVGRTHQVYAEFYNAKYHHHGHLWQNRFYSCPMDLEHTLNALAYVELNPVRAKMSPKAIDYPWSSAAAHLGLRGDRLLNLSKWFSEFTAEEWSEVLEGMEEQPNLIDEVRRHTLKGRPLGTDRDFLDQISEWRATR